MVGQVDYLTETVGIFCRLKNATVMGDLTEIDVPNRFIFLLLGSMKNSNIWEFQEMGRTMGTLLSDRVCLLNVTCKNYISDIISVNTLQYSTKVITKFKFECYFIIIIKNFLIRSGFHWGGLQSQNKGGCFEWHRWIHGWCHSSTTEYLGTIHQAGPPQTDRINGTICNSIVFDNKCLFLYRATVTFDHDHFFIFSPQIDS